jgi:hypothetical protein
MHFTSSKITMDLAPKYYAFTILLTDVSSLYYFFIILIYQCLKNYLLHTLIFFSFQDGDLLCTYYPLHIRITIFLSVF